MFSNKRVAAILIAAIYPACAPTLQNAARDPDLAVPTTYTVSQTSTTSSASSANVLWQDFFVDPALHALIDTALQNNQELEILNLEIGIANNEIMARRGEFLPRLDFRAGAGIDKVGRDTAQGVSDEAHDVAENLQDYRFGFVASWEIDVWKKLSNATKAATQRYLCSIEGRKFMVTQLVREIANTYYELLTLDAQLAVLQENIEIQRNALEVVRLQKDAARVTELAVKRFEAEVLKNRSRRYTLQQQITETENRLNFLVGRFPQPIERSRFDQAVPARVQQGLPSDLLENRPDVRQAELRLEAAKLDVAVARARFYPSIELSAGLGYQSFDITRLLATPASLIYGLAADLVAPLLNRKGLTAAYFTSNAQQMQAVVEYERTILRAYNEAANQVSMIHNLELGYALRAEEVQRLTQSIEISSGLFRSARADYMEVLLTRRDALESQMELLEMKQQQMRAMVDLYQALGGGWRVAAATTGG